MKSAIENFRTYLVIEKSLEENSVEAYINDINKMFKFCEQQFQVVHLKDITYSILNEYLKWAEKQGITNRTRCRCISSIKSFFKFQVSDGDLQSNPAELLTTPKIEHQKPCILTTEEINAILNAGEMYKPEGQRNKAIVEILYSCGLRVSELITLKLSNINFRSGTVKIEGKENKERLISLSKNAKLVKRANIKKNVSPQTFRHSFANRLKEEGADLQIIQKMLGHKSILTTDMYYSD